MIRENKEVNWSERSMVIVPLWQNQQLGWGIMRRYCPTSRFGASLHHLARGVYGIFRIFGYKTTKEVINEREDEEYFRRWQMKN